MKAGTKKTLMRPLNLEVSPTPLPQRVGHKDCSGAQQSFFQISPGADKSFVPLRI